MAPTPTVGMKRIGQSCGRNSEKVKDFTTRLRRFVFVLQMPAQRQDIENFGSHQQLKGLLKICDITPADKYPQVVIPSRAGIQKNAGCPGLDLGSGMTGLAISSPG
jgi:hypothetical protein